MVDRHPSILTAEAHMKEALSCWDKSVPDIGRWSHWTAKMREAIPGFSTPTEVLRFAQGELPFTHLERTPPEVVSIAYQLLEREFPWLQDKIEAVEENPASIVERLLRCDGRLVSNMFLWHLRSVFAAQTFVDKTAKVLEIGTGYGAFCRLWLLSDIKPCERYVLVDVPESLFFAEVCLRETFGGDVGYFLGRDPGTRILLVPVPKLEEFKGETDLVINIGSLQEMSTEWVRFYMNWIDHTSPGFFYSLNYVASPLALMAESRNYWAPRLSPRWSTLHINPDPPLVKMMCIGRDFCEAIYELKPAMGRLVEWSHWSGRKISRQSFIEGLDLLRQDQSQDNTNAFFDAVVDGWPGPPRTLPKELMAIATDDARRARIESLIGGYAL